MLFWISAGEDGSNSKAASAAISIMEVQFEHAHGISKFIASSRGSPKPSEKEGNTNIEAFL